MNGRVVALAALLTLVAACSVGSPSESPESVILVHGLGRSSASMTLLGSRLQSAGFGVVNFEYPSTTEPMEQLVDRLAAEVDLCCREGAQRVHFVTHSMGGVLVRSYLGNRQPPNGGRVVMLSPPNQGSEIIDAFSPSPLLVSILGPAGARLGTDSTSITSRLGPVRFPLGIITGDRSFTRLGSWLIPGPDDGLVGVDQARVEGTTDFMVVSSSHTFIMNRSEVAAAIVSFLREGAFEPGIDLP